MLKHFRVFTDFRFVYVPTSQEFSFTIIACYVCYISGPRADNTETQEEPEIEDDHEGTLCTHCILVDSSTVMYWTSPFAILGGVRSILSLSVMDKSICHYTPALKKWGVYWFTSVRHSVCPSVRPSVIP